MGATVSARVMCARVIPNGLDTIVRCEHAPRVMLGLTNLRPPMLRTDWWNVVGKAYAIVDLESARASRGLQVQRVTGPSAHGQTALASSATVVEDV